MKKTDWLRWGIRSTGIVPGVVIGTELYSRYGWLLLFVIVLLSACVAFLWWTVATLHESMLFLLKREKERVGRGE